MRLSTDDLAFFFEPHHHELAAHLRRVCAGPLAAQADSGQAARDMGAREALYRWLVPETGPPDVRGLCLIREALGQISPMADAIFAVQGLGSTPIAIAGNAEQRSLLPQVRDGTRICAFGLTEPGAGSDVSAISTRAARTASGWELNGEKVYISNASIAGHVVVFATTDPEAGRKGITAFLVELPRAGVEVEALPMGGDHPVGRLTLQRCEVPAGALIGQEGGGFALAMATLDTFRVTVGAAAVGMARRALEETVEHTKRRVQFSKPLAAQQLVQGHLADMATDLDAARLLVYRAAHAKDTLEGRHTAAVSKAKLFATEAAQRIIDQAVQLHGGLGVTRGSSVEMLYREIRPLRIYEGASDIQRLIIARDLTRGDS